MSVKGLYVIEGHNYPDFEELENRGLTHVFYFDSYLLNDYDICKNNIRELIKTLNHTDLKLHIDLNAFRASDRSSLVDPTNMDHRSRLKSALKDLLNDIPRIEGISFDDFHWHDWSGYNEDEQSKILAEFAREMANAVHEVEPSKKISASINWSSNTLPKTASELDMVIAKIYSTNSNNIPLSKALKTVLEEIDNTDVVVELLTYDTAVNLDPRSLSDIYNEISTVINLNGPNYCLYASPWIPFGLGFPSVDYSFTEIKMDLNLVSKKKTIPEKSSRILTISFTDQNDNPLSDDLLKTVVGNYKITDQSTGRTINKFTSFIPDKSIYELLISSDENRIINQDVSQENHIITVSVVYGNGKKENNELTLTIINLMGIS
jgi:hypothetical protein